MPKSIPTNSERNSSLSATSHRQLRGTNDLQEGAKINYRHPQKENNNNKSSPLRSGEDKYKRKTPDPSSRAPLSPKRQKYDDDDYHLRVDEGTAKNNDIGSSGRIGTKFVRCMHMYDQATTFQFHQNQLEIDDLAAL